MRRSSLTSPSHWHSKLLSANSNVPGHTVAWGRRITMTYTAHEGADTTMAGFAHLGALTGPLVPWLIYLGRRGDDEFSAREAAKATNYGMAVLVIAVVATIVRLYVPFIGFLGTLAQLALLVTAVFYSVQAYRSVQRGTPASYPFKIKVVKTND